MDRYLRWERATARRAFPIIRAGRALARGLGSDAQLVIVDNVSPGSRHAGDDRVYALDPAFLCTKPTIDLAPFVVLFDRAGPRLSPAKYDRRPKHGLARIDLRFDAPLALGL